MSERKDNFEWVKVTDLVPASYNPRNIKDENFQGLRESIRRFGIVDTLVVNKRNRVIVGGHRRLDAAILEGHTEVPVRWCTLTEAEEKTLNLVLNNKNIQGDFTIDLMKVIESIKALDLSINLDALRLSDLDLKSLLPPSGFDDWASDLGKINNVDSDDRGIQSQITLVFKEQINIDETKEVIKNTLGFLNFDFG